MKESVAFVFLQAELDEERYLPLSILSLDGFHIDSGLFLGLSRKNELFLLSS